MPEGLVGQSLPRSEDLRFLTGRGRYVADIDMPGAAHAVLLRSPHAHAAIRGVDVTAARAAPGVLSVATIADLDADGIGDLTGGAFLPPESNLVKPRRPVLARDAVHYVGEPVAFVVAETEAQARDAAELIAVEYEILPAVVDGAAALAEGAPRIWPEVPGNLAFHFRAGDRAAVDAAFAAAAHVVTCALHNQRVHALPLEPRAAIARHAAGRFELILSGQGVHGIRDQIAGPVFHLPDAQFHVVAPDVGGGFGAKNFVFSEYPLLLWAARKLGRSVRWHAGASEDIAAMVHGRDLRGEARLALDAEGHFLALEVRGIANLGAYCSPFGPRVPTVTYTSAMGGVYAIPAMHHEVRGAYTNSVPVDAYRGAGKPEANYTIERLVDAAARQCGFDPVALRRRNMIARFPYRAPFGQVIDGGRFAANLDIAARASDAEGFAARRAASEARGRLRGRGIACFLETARGAPGEDAAVRFNTDGTVTLATGTQSNGQGHETSFAQVAADRLGLPLACFRLAQGDTEAIAEGKGHGGARSMHMGGGALVLAIEAVLAKARVIAAHLLQADGGQLDFAEGRFTVRGTERGVALPEVARAASDPANLPDGMAPGLQAEAKNGSDLITFPNGCHVAEVEVDPETGAVALERYIAVDDYGRLINPRLTAGQVQGGLAQGIGQALMERIAYDPESGQLLSGTLMDYALPRASDLPPLDVVLEGVPTESNPLGVKGSGQAGCIAAPQTVVHAVLDALAPFGVTALDMPLTAERIWRAMNRGAG